jgi:hypothetical protein
MAGDFIEIKPIKYTHVDKRVYSNEDPRLPQHPNHVLVCGKTNSGKTHLVANIILEGYIPFNRVFIIAKRIEQEIWEEVIAVLEERAEEAGIDLDSILFIATGDNIPTLEEIGELLHGPNGEKPEETNLQTMIIIDDYMTDRAVNREVLRYISQVRHFNASVWYLSQSYFTTEKFIRENVNYVILFSGQNLASLTLLYRDITQGDITKEKFIQLYSLATEKPHHFFLIDKLAKNPRTRYREGFDTLLIEE